MHLVTALASALTPDNGVPTEIVYIPEGSNLIYPKSHPKGISVNMPESEGESVAASFNSILETLQKGNIRPRLDFKHEADGPASGYPTGFRYQSGKGLMCSVDWSGAGKSAIEGRDYAYFSPRFDLGDNGIPSGLPDRGPLGALVNEPAFREIERIAASVAEIQTIPNMITILATCGLLTAAEASLPDAETLAARRVVEKASRITELEAELAVLTKTAADAVAECTAARKDRAKGIVEAAIADGRLAPKDDATNSAFTNAIEAELASGVNLTQTIIASLPKRFEGLETPIVKGGDKTITASDKPELSGHELLEASLAEEFAAAK